MGALLTVPRGIVTGADVILVVLFVGGAFALLDIPVPSVNGQAVLTMPIMAPLSDLLGLSRGAVVIAYQTGAGLMDMITPINSALLAMLLAAGISYARWLAFVIPGALLVALVGLRRHRPGRMRGPS